LVRGVGLNPGTALEALEPLLDELELILILAVNPGWGGRNSFPPPAGELRKQRG
jgi:ribulose-phosphate 3-epimerase